MAMPKSHKPLIWGLFAGGGTLAAFLAPVLVLITGLAVPVFGPEVMSYDVARGVAANWFGKLVIFGIVGLMLWHAAHRLRITAHDFGISNDFVVRVALYSLAGLLTLLMVIFLLSI